MLKYQMENGFEFSKRYCWIFGFKSISRVNDPLTINTATVKRRHNTLFKGLEKRERRNRGTDLYSPCFSHFLVGKKKKKKNE